MLKDKILKNIHDMYNDNESSIKPKDQLEFPMEGILKITGTTRDGEVYHTDEAHNTVMVWARHAMLHALTGESFSGWGTRRVFNGEGAIWGTGSVKPYYQSPFAEHATSVSGAGGNNPDGTLLSGKPYFYANGTEYSIDKLWSRSTATVISPDPTTAVNLGNLTMPFFPSKMLFGTGVEFLDWEGDVPIDYKTIYEGDGWGDGTGGTTNFTTNIGIDSNYLYSNKTYSGGIYKTRTMNDIYAQKIQNEPLNTELGISGAIKNGGYFSESDKETKTELINGKRFLKQELRGVGLPCFVYVDRTQRNYISSSATKLSADNSTETGYENKLTYKITLPTQDDDIFYPYNGFYLKQIGLFCDAGLVFNNLSTGSIQYNKMPAGMLFAKRNIAPIEKSHETNIVAEWTLYF
jgi:hypothetical protein